MDFEAPNVKLDRSRDDEFASSNAIDARCSAASFHAPRCLIHSRVNSIRLFGAGAEPVRLTNVESLVSTLVPARRVVLGLRLQE
jgi:hypothetical protein